MTNSSVDDQYSDPLFSVPSVTVGLVQDVSELRVIVLKTRLFWLFPQYTYTAGYYFTHVGRKPVTASVNLKPTSPFTGWQLASAYQRISESRANLLNAVKAYQNPKVTPQDSFDEMVSRLAVKTQRSRTEVLQSAVNLYSSWSTKRWDQWCAQNPGAQECKMYDV
jgi:hypothetical protein